ncbi:MAG: HNH endonuclease family protein [Nocardioides sp.]
MRRALVCLLALVLAGGMTAMPVAASAEEYAAKLRRAVADLPMAPEVRKGYEREKFFHWIDADDDGCSTRDEVLLVESTTSTTVSGTCTIEDGRWFSYYDRQEWTDPSDVDIDHLVPLAEAWDSGARRWRPAVRTRFANDLHDRRSLVAVTDNVNQSKSDRDPADWLPDHGRCRYVREWVAVKHRWRLRVDRAEKRVLRDLAGSCDNERIRVRIAR